MTEPGLGTMGDKEWNNIDNFERSEFRYRPEYADVKLVKKLDKLRSRLTEVFGDAVYVIIHVCAGKPGDHAEGSYHYPEEHGGQAMAADLHISFPDELHRPVLELACIMEIGFGGIGYYPAWSPVPGWHLDVRASTHWPVYWIPDGEGDYLYGLKMVTQAIEEVCRDG